MTTGYMDTQPAEQAAELLFASVCGRILQRTGAGFIFDLDDTLIENQSIFTRAAHSIAEIIARIAGAPHRRDALQEAHNAYDLSLIPTLGVNPTRWRTSALTYAAEVIGRPLTVAETAELLAAAEEALRVGAWLPGALRTLQALKRWEIPTAILTRGEQEKQAEKLAVRGIDDLVFDITITDDKRGEFEAFLANPRRPGATVWFSVGDSPRSDIEPALAAGLQAVHVTGAPNAGWDGGPATTNKSLAAPSAAHAVWAAMRELCPIFDHVALSDIRAIGSDGQSVLLGFHEERATLKQLAIRADLSEAQAAQAAGPMISAGLLSSPGGGTIVLTPDGQLARQTLLHAADAAAVA